MNLALFFIIIFSSFSTSASTRQILHCVQDDMFNRHPERSEGSFAQPQVDSRWDNGYPEHRYQFVLQKAYSTYAPIIEDLGGTLQFISDWQDGAVNMWADRIGDEYILEIPGGFSRYHLINEEAFILTICHELGHLLGGEPARGLISYEGQSDYFSTLECSKKLFLEITTADAPLGTPAEEEFCQTHKSKSLEECLRHTRGMLSVTSYFAEIINKAFPLIETPDPSIAPETIFSHPAPQCRLDTLLAGYLGNPRPRCWFLSR